ncbi:MAG: sensor histidine kinase, partial [Acidimicrobiales bacterium]
LRGLLQEHQALLQGISDGVVGCDNDGIVQFANDEARRLLRLPTTCIGRPLPHLVRGKRLREVLAGEYYGRDLPVVVGNAILSISRLNVEHDGATLGFVITIQDRTEWESLLRELDGMVGMTDALRAQAHEFSNRLHTIVGLIELGNTEEAVSFAVNLSSRRSLPSSTLDSVDDPMLKALLLAKSAVASEKGISLHVADDTNLPGSLQHPIDVLTIVGNLIDNAIDAVLESSPLPLIGALDSFDERGWITLRMRTSGEDLAIDVSDSGNGIDPEIESSIFVDGFSTKTSSRGTRRGLGLAMIAQIVAKYNGSITVTSNPGATFAVVLPGAILPEDDLEPVAPPSSLVKTASLNSQKDAPGPTTATSATASSSLDQEGTLPLISLLSTKVIE